MNSESESLESIDILTVGQQIARARTAQGMTVNEMAQRTKISASLLRAIEEERFDAIPDVRVYVRGFLWNISHVLGLAPSALGEPYLERWEAWRAERGA
jgi:cytoskeletal protein RodZ